MFCPFLSMGKNKLVECSPECALYSGTLDAVEKECAIFAISSILQSTNVRLTDMDRTVETVGESIREAIQNLPSGN